MVLEDTFEEETSLTVFTPEILSFDVTEDTDGVSVTDVLEGGILAADGAFATSEPTPCCLIGLDVVGVAA